MKINIDLLKEFEKSIDTSKPEKGKVPIKILGYGEISLVFEIVGDSQKVAYKRIPIFDTEKQAKRHVWAYNEYNKLLISSGLNLPDYDVAYFINDNNEIQFYCVQEKLNPDSVCNKIIHKISDQEINTLVLLAMREIIKVWDYSFTNKKINLGLDGQISNFCVMNYNSNNLKITKDTKLLYIDTSTPMFRIHGKEAMDAVLLLKSAPSFLRGILKALFLEETVGRYYDLRKVAIDLVANFIKEQKPELVPGITRLVNKFFKEEASKFDIAPLTLEEIQKYYKSDAQMWDLFQTVRKFDRFLKIKVLKKKYNFYLPGKIERY